MPNNNRLQLVWAGLARNNRWSSYICQKDVDTFNRRMEGEGSEFYARALGQFRTSFLTGLGKGEMRPVKGFGPKRNSVLPRFLYNATSAVFTDDGVIRDIIDVDAVACVNQLTAVFTKIDGGHTLQSERDVIENFVNTEKEMASKSIDYSMHFECYQSYGNDSVKRISRPLGDIMEDAARLVKRILAGVDPREISPKHGSGVSACGTKVRDRYAAPRYVEKIDRIWPMSEYYYLGTTAFCDGLEEYLAQPELDPCAKVLLVPKDARGPRLISCEPRETMWIQQGLMGLLYDTIEGHYLTRRRVNFTRQGFNQCAAFYGSLLPQVAGRRVSDSEIGTPLQDEFSWSHDECNQIDPAYMYRMVKYHEKQPHNNSEAIGFNTYEPTSFTGGLQSKIAVRQAQTERRLRGRGLHLDPRSPVAGKLATLDLKDASDKLRLDVVERLFPVNWYEALSAARSSQTKLPDGRVINLTKHAPMGSACCFPVMALVIWSVLTAIAPKGAARHILVYGDDIIVPTFMAEDAMDILTAIGFTINREKSFTRGPFRESCGEEFVCGCRVTPVRLRHMIADDAESRMAAFAFSNNMLDSEWLSDNEWFINHLEEWYGPDKVPILARQWKNHASWLSQAQKLKVGFATQYRTLSGVVYCKWAWMVRLPSGKDRRIHGSNQSADKPAYWVPEYRLTVPIPCFEEYETSDWCHVLRSLLSCNETESGFDAIHNCVRFKRQWRVLD